MDCSLPGSSTHGIFHQEYWSGAPLPSPTRVVSYSFLQEIFQAWNTGLLHCSWIFYQLSHQGNPTMASLLLFSSSVVSDSLRPNELQHTRLPCPSPSPGACSNSCPSSYWCHPTISSSVVPFSSHLQSFPASGSFPMNQFFTSGRQSIAASASVLPMNIQDWFPLGWTGLISLLSKGLSRIFSNPTVQEHQFFGTQPSLWSNSHIHT